MNVDIYENVNDIIKKFMCCYPIDKILLKKSLSEISWENQQYLLNNTIKNNLVLKYPLKISYQKVFLKSVIEILEKNNIEVYDDIYKSYCNILNRDSSEKYFFKHYIVENEVITLKENINFISEGTTGLCSWQASLVLSEWCLFNKDQLRNKSILELGSGVGLLGLTVFKTCKPKLLVLSDYHSTVLNILSENVLLNSDLTVDSLAKNSSGCEISVKDFPGDRFGTTVNFSDNISDSTSEKCFISDTNVKLRSDVLKIVNLNWNFVNKNTICEQINPDVILAADVVYDSCIFKPLCDTINFFLYKNSKTEVYLACTERNAETLTEFLNLLVFNNLKIKKLSIPEPVNFYWSTEIPIRLFLITKEERKNN